MAGFLGIELNRSQKNNCVIFLAYFSMIFSLPFQLVAKPLKPLTSYDRNKMNNMISHIVLPTDVSSALSTPSEDSPDRDEIAVNNNFESSRYGRRSSVGENDIIKDRTEDDDEDVDQDAKVEANKTPEKKLLKDVGVSTVPRPRRAVTARPDARTRLDLARAAADGARRRAAAEDAWAAAAASAESKIL